MPVIDKEMEFCSRFEDELIEAEAGRLRDPGSNLDARFVMFNIFC